jgi:hypothetical protein
MRKSLEISRHRHETFDRRIRRFFSIFNVLSSSKFVFMKSTIYKYNRRKVFVSLWLISKYVDESLSYFLAQCAHKRQISVLSVQVFFSKF